MSSVDLITTEVEESHAGLRLDRFLSAMLPELSRTRLQALIREGRVAAGGATIEDAKYRVKPGDRFEIAVPSATETPLAAQPIPLDIVYEDDDLIVIDKPAGLAVHPGAGQADGTLVNALLAHCGGSLSGIGGVARPGIVHRLDKDTSGLIVVAKTDRAHRALAEQFADHGRTGDLERSYLALVWGVPSRRQGVVKASIGRHPTSRIKMAVLADDKGRRAATHWRVQEVFGRGPEGGPMASLVACTLETGRTHQVRVHMAYLGHPLLGDPLYGQGFKSRLRKLPEPARSKVERLSRQALHAARLAFVHPLQGTLLEFNSPLPDDLAEIAETLKQL
jgi:23S rRNA pseudouridine1911/1915/1917 synthase